MNNREELREEFEEETGYDRVMSGKNKLKIYVASSWRNEQQQEVVKLLRGVGHTVYDFKDPALGFHWRDIDSGWREWTPQIMRQALDHHLLNKVFAHDFEAMKWADACVTVLPCGRSAHLETGWFIGNKKPSLILLSDGDPEMMYKMATKLCISVDEVIEELKFVF